jgi:glucose-1-phosphate thymidylyltransferase
MRGVVLAGGTGSRLWPLTKVTNKHLLPVGPVPMIWHPVWKLVRAGLEEILIVSGTDHLGDVVSLLGSGRDYGCHFTYRVQDEAGGIAEALGLAEHFSRGERLCVILGDNLLEEDLGADVQAFRSGAAGARILLAEVQDPSHYGVAGLKDGRVTSLEEKPARPASNLAVTGIYCYDGGVFDIVRALEPSSRGELEITDVNRAYLAAGRLEHRILSGWWQDAGTPEGYAAACARALAAPAPFPDLRRP